MFKEKGEVISESDESVFPSKSETYNQILSDITTSFTFLVAIFFPSVTGEIHYWNFICCLAFTALVDLNYFIPYWLISSPDDADEMSC